MTEETKRKNCPQCGSEEYGYDLDSKGHKHWSCLSCKLGMDDTSDGYDRNYAAQYAYACGYRD